MHSTNSQFLMKKREHRATSPSEMISSYCYRQSGFQDDWRNQEFQWTQWRTININISAIDYSIPPQFMAHIQGKPWQPRKQSTYQHLHKILNPAPVNYRNMDSLPHSLTIPEEDRNFKALGLTPNFLHKLRM
jgi:hypothetical protein